LNGGKGLPGCEDASISTPENNACGKKPSDLQSEGFLSLPCVAGTVARDPNTQGGT
jgi:hypothetical protein